MARKLKINYVKSSSATSFLAKMRIKVDISPDSWSSDSFAFWYRVGDDPTDSNHLTAIPFKSQTSANGKWIWKWARITGLTTGLKYHIIATGVGDSGTRYKSSVTIETPTASGADNAVLCITNSDGEWEDFSDCIPVPDYKVNNTAISEEWTDANRNVHSNVVQTRIEGTFDLKFPNRTRLNKFLACVKYNEDTYGKGRVRLKVQVNNELDLDDTTTPIASAVPMTYIDFFKMEWDPDWALPFFGTTHDYSPISVKISEIEE